jgi:hypothetical protein
MRLERQVAVAHVVGSSAYRRRTALVTTQVLLWRTLLVGCIASGLFAIFVAPRMMHACGGGSKADVTALTVRRFAFEAFPQWAAVHHMNSCPSSLDELRELASTSPIDAWGNPLEMRCGPLIRGIYVRSAGEDGQFETPDDITSNDG